MGRGVCVCLLDLKFYSWIPSINYSVSLKNYCHYPSIHVWISIYSVLCACLFVYVMMDLGEPSKTLHMNESYLMDTNAMNRGMLWKNPRGPDERGACSQQRYHWVNLLYCGTDEQVLHDMWAWERGCNTCLHHPTVYEPEGSHHVEATHKKSQHWTQGLFKGFCSKVTIDWNFIYYHNNARFRYTLCERLICMLATFASFAMLRSFKGIHVSHSDSNSSW